MARDSEDFVWTPCAQRARPVASLIFGIAATFSVVLLLVIPPKPGAPTGSANTGEQPLMMSFSAASRPAPGRVAAANEHVLPDLRQVTATESHEKRSASLQSAFPALIKPATTELGKRSARTPRFAKKSTGNRGSRHAGKSRRVWVVIAKRGAPRNTTVVRGWVRNGRVVVGRGDLRGNVLRY
jgi:hypothetical protein